MTRLIGMFAFAVWNRQQRTLSLVRDRMGIKPLYWGRVGGRIAFASELEALRTLPGFTGDIDRNALVGLLRNNHIPTPVTIYKDVEKLPPGSIATIDSAESATVKRYWDLLTIAGTSVPDMDESEAVDTFEHLLRDATVAQHLGADHTEEHLDAKSARDLVASLPPWYDEPFADMSQLPTYLVSRMTRKQVTVALSGDGGDEVFAGYTRYLWSRSFARTAAILPSSLRRMISTGVQRVSPEHWSALSSLLPRKARPPQAGERLHKVAQIVRYDDPDEIYRALVSQWQDPANGVIGGAEPGGVLFDESLRERIPHPVSRM